MRGVRTPVSTTAATVSAGKPQHCPGRPKVKVRDDLDRQGGLYLEMLREDIGLLGMGAT